MTDQMDARERAVATREDDATIREDDATSREDDATSREHDVTVKEALIAGLAARVTKLDVNTGALVRAVNQSRWERFTILVLLILVAALGLRNYEQSQTNHATLQAQQKLTSANRQTNLAIESCTVPTGTCYQRGAKATALAITNVNTFTLIAIECAHIGGDNTAIEQCVQKRVRAALVRS